MLPVSLLVHSANTGSKDRCMWIQVAIFVYWVCSFEWTLLSMLSVIDALGYAVMILSNMSFRFCL